MTGVGLAVKRGEIQLRAVEAPLLVHALVVEAAIISVLILMSTARAAVEVIVWVVVKVAIMATRSHTPVVPVVVAFAMAVPVAWCTPLLAIRAAASSISGARCASIRVWAAPTPVDVRPALQLVVIAVGG
jgi:hypothetical protein